MVLNLHYIHVNKHIKHLLPHWKPCSNGLLHCSATYTTFSMHTTFSISLVTLVHRQGTFAFVMTPQQPSEGGIFGFAGNITYCLHSLIRLERSFSQPPSAWEPTMDMATTKERTKNKLGSFAMFTSYWGRRLKVTKRTVLWCEWF